MNYYIEPLTPRLNKRDFCCGKALLDKYLHQQANQDIKRLLCTVSVLVDQGRVIGYYTLSTTSISKEHVPEEVRRKMPSSYHNLPAVLLGRLAVDKNYKGKRLGEYLLLDALKKSFEVSLSYIGAMAVIVDPLDADAEKFYAKYDFIRLDSGKMFLPMQTIGSLF